MPSYEPKTGNEPSDNDRYMSGRYLVTSVRHQINIGMKKHVMVLECMKDSVRIPYPEEVNDTFIEREKNNEGIIDIYEFDWANSLNNYEKNSETAAPSALYR